MAALSDILHVTRERVRQLEGRRRELERAAAAAPTPAAWATAFAVPTVAVIAEVKRRSPSAGPIAPLLDPAALAAQYAAGGARAVSVLTDGPHFGGSLDDLKAVRGAVSLPVLRKDFLIDPIQLFEARAAGASAVLLIVRVLEAARLRELSELARALGLGRLVEVHTLAELERAVALQPEAIGVNSRDLDTFQVDPAAVEPVLAAVPREIVAVAESGIGSTRDVQAAARAGADAVLVGTSVAAAADPRAAVAALAGVPRPPGGRTGAGAP